MLQLYSIVDWVNLKPWQSLPAIMSVTHVLQHNIGLAASTPPSCDMSPISSCCASPSSPVIPTSTTLAPAQPMTLACDGLLSATLQVETAASTIIIVQGPCVLTQCSASPADSLSTAVKTAVIGAEQHSGLSKRMDVIVVLDSCSNLAELSREERTVGSRQITEVVHPLALADMMSSLSNRLGNVEAANQQLAVANKQRAAEIQQLVATAQQQAAEIQQLMVNSKQQTAEIQQLMVDGKQQAADIKALVAITRQLTVQSQQRAAEIQERAAWNALRISVYVEDMAAQILSHATGATFSSTKTTKFSRLGSGHPSVAKLAAALEVDPDEFVVAADRVVEQRNGSTHYGSVQQLDEAVQELTVLLAPAQRTKHHWECIVLDNYDLIKKVFAAGFSL